MTTAKTPPLAEGPPDSRILTSSHDTVTGMETPSAKGRLIDLSSGDVDGEENGAGVNQSFKSSLAAQLLESGETNEEGSSGSDSEADAVIASRPRQISERRRAQNAKFSSWLSKRAEKETKEEVIAAIQKTDDEALSIRNLMSKQESNVIITDPREYQLELFERAKKQNIIAVLDTGSGKTLIAVLLLKYMLDRELEDRALGKKPRIAFFLVDSVTLVFQQFAVLECNLDQSIDRFCGEMGCKLWDKTIWEKHFKKNMVIVCTAEVLNQCLMHSFVTMAQINLLIFDEAHHAKKNHAYARIIKDFYLAEEDCSRRPKIFGMTASPVDAKVDVVEAAKQLETLLHCEIATTANLPLLRMSISRPNEQIAEYDSLPPRSRTSLCAEMKSRFGDMQCFSKLLSFSQQANAELGEWCADQVWSFGLAGEEANRLERKFEQDFHAEKQARPLEILDAGLARIRDAKNFVESHSFHLPSFSGISLSSKVKCLHAYLQRIFERPTEAKCLVFVKQRYTARLLLELMKIIGSPYLRLGVLIGARSAETGDVSTTFRQQILTLMKFHKGELNCLFATSVAEEGLDIPDCNTVIRFDLYSTLIQYIQSRGRARHKNSRFIHMVERGNRQHIQALQEVHCGEQLIREFCESLPADRLLQGNECTLADALSNDRPQRTYTEQSTGAKLTYGSSLTVLAHFTACLPHEMENVSLPTYVMSVDCKRYICEVILPENSPVHYATGRPSTTKAIAKRSAAFEACLLLRKGGYLDGNLLPIYHKQLPAMRNAHLALSMKKTNAYDMRVKPSIWERTRGSIPDELYMTVIELEPPENLGRPYKPLAILTRRRLPTFPPFPVYLQNDQMSQITCSSIPIAFKPTNERRASLTSFTLRIFLDLFNKRYEVNEPQISYWLAPILRDWKTKSKGHLSEALIDWPIVDLVDKHEELKWNANIAHKDLANRFLVDRWDGGRRFFSEGVEANLRPLDSVPDGCSAHKYMNTILDYTVSLFSKSRMRATWSHNQPVLRAHRVLHRRNLLDKADESEKTARTLSFVCPEPLKFSALPTTVVAMGYVFPAVLFRIESYLLALEACEMLRLEVDPHLALEAFTKDSDNTDEHRAEQVHFQRGMGKNYERLEFIGDCFLKMATSISIFAQHPDNDEFEYHVKRMLLICNKNLFSNAVKNGLHEYIRSQGFSRRNWYPEGIQLLEGKGHKKTGKEVHKHHLGDKTIADVCEALIGAALLSYKDSNDMDMAVKAVTEMVSSPDHAVRSWSEYYKLYTKPKYQIERATESQSDLAVKVEQKLAYHFRYPRLLRSAFVHPSHPFSWEKIPCYQRLEFLGDSLLDMACVNFLFYRYPDRDPQWLTEHKMAMVSNKFLGALSVRLGFHKHLRLNSASAQHFIQEYVIEIGEAEKESNGARDFWTTTKNPPKCLPDIVESYIGAVFVDSEFNYQEVERFFDAHVRWFFEDMSIYDTFANNHPTTYLTNLLTINFGCTNFRLMANELPSVDGSLTRSVAVVMIHDEIVSEGTASSGKNAKVKASSNALELLKGLPPFEYRSKYHCDCLAERSNEGEGNSHDIGSAI